jgi:hypothetical protein
MSTVQTRVYLNSFLCFVLVVQKYRLHTRRPPVPPTPATAAPQLVVLGGIWVPPEYAAQGAAPAIYGAHPATQPHYTAAVAAHQEYYPSPAAVHHPASDMVHRPAAALPPSHAYKAAMASSPPESEGRISAGACSAGVCGSGREMSESIEEEGEGDDREDDYDDDEEEMAAAKNDSDEAAAAGTVKY